MASWTQEAIAELSKRVDVAMEADLYAQARNITYRAAQGYEAELLSVVGAMMLEALDLGLGAHDLAEGLRALATRLDSALMEEATDEAAATEAWLYGDDPFGAEAQGEE